MITILVLIVLALLGAGIVALFTAAIPALLDIAVTVILIALVIRTFKMLKKKKNGAE